MHERSGTQSHVRRGLHHELVEGHRRVVHLDSDAGEREIEGVHVPNPPEDLLDHGVILPELDQVRPGGRDSRQVVRVHHLRRVAALGDVLDLQPLAPRALALHELLELARRRHGVRVPRDDVPEQKSVRVALVQ